MMMMMNMLMQVMHNDPVLACKEEQSLEGFLRRRLHQLSLPFQLVHIFMMTSATMMEMTKKSQ